MSIKASHTALVDHLKRLRVFDHVGEVEPDKAPGKGLYAALWFDQIRPAPDMSSLRSTSMVYTYLIRMYRSAHTSPGASIDPDLVAALDAVLESVIDDSRLGDTAYVVDVLGAYSDGMQAVTDYVDFGANATYRVIDLTLPVVLDGRFAHG